MHLSASVPLGAGAVLATYGSSKMKTAGVAAEPKSTMLSLAYQYSLSKRTDLYAVYMSDKYTARTNGNTLAAGVRHTF